jgi:hypothetical protein
VNISLPLCGQFASNPGRRVAINIWRAACRQWLFSLKLGHLAVL